MSDTLLLGLIGEGISASRTPRMHEAEGDFHGIRTMYRILDVTAPTRHGAELGELLTAAVRLGFNGLNVTHPFKQQVLDLLDEVDPGAQRIGSVNTVVIGEYGTTTGFNTDVTGFARGFAEGLDGAATGQVVQIGAGGAGRAVAFALSELGVDDLIIADVGADRAHDLAADIGAGVRAISTDELEAAVTSADGIVNATPVGMASFPGTPFDTGLLDPRMWVADVVYFPLETRLLREARDRGCRTLDGSGMAVNQAVDAFELFSGVRASPERMRRTFLSFGA